MVKRHPLLTFFVLAYLLTWWVYPLLQFSPLVGLLGLFGPAAAALIVAALSGGKAGARELLLRTVRWRVKLRWYVIALVLPAVLALVALGIYVLAGRPSSLPLGRVSVLDLIVFVLVIGEELGWRGYAFPRLVERFSPRTASLVLGLLWGAWHLPTFVIASMPQYGRPFVAFLIMTMSYAVLLGWAFRHTGGSVLIATLFHGAINLSQGFFLGAMDPGTQYWLLALVYGVAALVVAVRLGPDLARKAPPRRAPSGPGSRDGRKSFDTGLRSVPSVNSTRSARSQEAPTKEYR
jgi:uncharacterized protein